MEGSGLLKVGIGLSLAGVVLSFLTTGSTTADGADGLRFLAGLATLFGLAAMTLAIYTLVKPARTSLAVGGGAALFVLGRFFGMALATGGGGDPGLASVFLVLNVLSGLGTVLLFAGVYGAVQARIASNKPGPAGPDATLRAPAAPAGAPPRPSAFLPPQAPLNVRSTEETFQQL